MTPRNPQSPSAPMPDDSKGIFTSFVRAQPLGGSDAENAIAARLLKLGVRGPTRPVDRLIERLSRTDRGVWLDDAIREVSGSSTETVSVLTLTPSTPLGSIRALKDRCKRQAAKGLPGQEPLEPMLGYFIALAAAMAHHGALISSVPRSEIEGVLLDLACVLPDPWADLFCRATLAEMVVKA